MPFISDQSAIRQVKILAHLERKLANLLKIIENGHEISLSAPTLMVMYEGASDEEEGDEMSDVKMINFESSSVGTVRLGREIMNEEGGDTENVCKGIRNLIVLFREARKLANYAFNGLYPMPWSE